MSLFGWGRQTGGKTGGKAAPGNPLELITYDTSTGKFHLGKEALAVLRKVHGPVGVVAVSGRARQGKSFILNQLLGQSSGFTVASTHRPCTKGLWMWSTPVERQSSDGSKYHLVGLQALVQTATIALPGLQRHCLGTDGLTPLQVLLDTEGIDAYDQV